MANNKYISETQPVGKDADRNHGWVKAVAKATHNKDVSIDFSGDGYVSTGM
jgi:hypothetical protein